MYGDGESNLRSSERMSIFSSSSRGEDNGTLHERSISPSKVALPAETEMEMEALMETEVAELKGFADKALWIQEKIDFLRSLPSIECFDDLIPTFSDLLTSNLQLRSLPTRKELNEMFAEQDRIEEEADRFDAGDLERLRKMAKAASKKSLSRADTDLLAITLSTLYLLDTLHHLLRARGETLDLLSLRLQFDELRFRVGAEVLSWEGDITAFVEEKARWGLDQYDSTRKRQGSVTSTGEESRSESRKVASRSQRYLLTQILDLDCQSLQNRISALSSGPLASTGLLLDKMIDVASSLRARRKRRRITGSASSFNLASLAEAEEDDDAEGGAVPEWFLVEMDRIEERCGAMDSRHEFAASVAGQWKYIDNTYHSIQKLSSEAETVATSLAKATLEHPSHTTSSDLSTRINHLTHNLDLLPDPTSQSPNPFPRPTHSSFPDQPRINLELAKFLSHELRDAISTADKVKRQVEIYSKSVERAEKLEQLKAEMERDSLDLQSATKRLEEGHPEHGSSGFPLDLSSQACLLPDAHSFYLAQVPLLSDIISSIQTRSPIQLRESATLLLMLRSSSLDPSFRAAVETIKEELRASIDRAVESRDRIDGLVESISTCKEIQTESMVVAAEGVVLKEAVLVALKKARWRDGEKAEDETESATHHRSRLAAIDAALKTTASKLAPSLISKLSEQSPALLSHLQNHLTTLHRRSSSLRDLLHLLQNVRSQNEALCAVQAESQPLHRQTQVYLDSIRTALHQIISPGSNDPAESPALNLDQLSYSISSLVSSLHVRIPFVNSPTFSSALLSDRPPALSLSQSSLLTPPGSPTHLYLASLDLPFSPTTGSIDLSSHDALIRAEANQIAASLAGALEEVREATRLIPVASQVRSFERSLPAVEEALERAIGRISMLSKQLVNTVARPTDFFEGISESQRLANLQTLLSDAPSLINAQLEPTKRSLFSLQVAFQPLAAQSHVVQQHLAILPLSARLVSLQSTFAELETQAELMRARVDQAARDQGVLVDEETKRLQEEAGRNAARRSEDERLVREARVEMEERLEVEKAKVESRRPEEAVARSEAKRVEVEGEEAEREEDRTRKAEQAEGDPRKPERLVRDEQEHRSQEDRHADQQHTTPKLDGTGPSTCFHRDAPSCNAFPPSTPTAVPSAIDVFGPVSPVRSTSSRRSNSPSPRPSPQAFPISLPSPLPASEDPTSGLETILALQERLDSLHLPPSPSAAELDQVSKVLASVEAEDALLPPCNDPYETQALLLLRRTLSDLISRLADARTLLVFDSSVVSCDAALSKLLDEIDAYPCPSRPSIPASTLPLSRFSSQANQSQTASSRSKSLRTHLADATSAHQIVVSLAAKTPSSSHVTSENSRLASALAEMGEMVEETLNPSSRSLRRESSLSTSTSSVASSSINDNEEDNRHEDFASEFLDRPSSSLSRSSGISRSSSTASFKSSSNSFRRSTSSISNLPRQNNDPRTLSSFFRSRSSLSNNDTDAPTPRRSISSLSQQSPRQSRLSLSASNTKLPRSSSSVSFTSSIDRIPIRSQVSLTKSSSTFGLATAARAVRSSLSSLPRSSSSTSMSHSPSRLPQPTTRRARLSTPSSSFSLSASSSHTHAQDGVLPSASSRVVPPPSPSLQHSSFKLPIRSRLPSSFGFTPAAPQSTSGSSSIQERIATMPLSHAMTSTAASRSRSSMSSPRPRTSSTISSSSSSQNLHLPSKTSLSPVLSAQSFPSRIPTFIASPQQHPRSSLSSQQRPTPTRTSIDRFSSTPSRRRSSSVRHLADLSTDDLVATPTRKNTGGGAGIEEKKKYVAKKGDKLDKAVGKIVNSFSVEIAITPVVSGPSHESGKYWIGQPPKLVFCRILRSKTVMVRVGGGWVELSKFLRDHFGINIPTPSAATASTSSPTRSPYAGDGAAPRSPWIRGGTGAAEYNSLSSSTSSRMLFSPSASLSATATRHTHSTYLLSTPSRSSVHSSSRFASLSPPQNNGSPSATLFYPTSSSGEGANHSNSSNQQTTPTFSYQKRWSSALPPFKEGVMGENGGAGDGSPVPVEIMRKADEGASPGQHGMSMVGLGIAGSPLGDMRGSGGGRNVSGSLSGIPWR